ncbi:MAG: metallophosphoesterase, partial [SAR324 cluster bacterium]|nr:metallophosphoesterase [SAR324 cluster bacterium]
MVDKKIIAIADPHLGIVPGDVEEMIRFIGTLNPAENDLLFLGDLFHIWAGPLKYQTPPVKSMLAALTNYRQQNGKVFLVVGNRDVFLEGFPENKRLRNLPFDGIFPEFGTLDLGERQVMAVHGDTINTLDARYLKWRRTIRHPLFERVFDLMPAAWVKKIMFRLESDLQVTNLDFRKSFPVAEWDHFVDRISSAYSPGLLLSGHFHPKDLIIKKAGETTAIVVPDWYKSGTCLKVESDLTYELCRLRNPS